jgi:hypothetical protein
MPKSSLVPVPLKLAVCGLFAALSAIERVPLTGPVVAGSNATLIVQLAPATRLDPQSFVSVKLALTVMRVMLSIPLPVFVNETA